MSGEAMGLDIYGGVKRDGSYGAAPAFRIVKQGRRFLLATPEGNPFWLKACYGIDITDGGEGFVRALHEKYKNDPTYKTWGYWWPFVATAARNLKMWGFNALGECTSNYALPVVSHNRGRANEEKMPFMIKSDAAHYSKQRYGVKNLMLGVDEAVTRGLWRVEGFPDVFDPAFARAVDELTGAGQSPWLLASSTDDRDYLFGFGPTRQFGGWHNHLGWQAAATRPTQDSNVKAGAGTKAGATYADKTVYTKLALRDFLRDKYRTIEQLNAAWGSRYTTWDSDGGAWPSGRGLLDESGRSPWLGRDFYALTDSTPGVRADLDAFVGVIADKYFSIATGVLRRKRPGHLVSGTATISPHAHPEILRAAGRWCDMVQFSNDGGAPAFSRGYSLVRKPFYVWTTFMAQADSPLAATKGWAGDLRTQEERGRSYARFISELIAFRGDDDTFPCLGIDWWAYSDKVTGGESHNFGLVTTRDNPYDGVAARVMRGTDRWGNPIGGEARDYGDFVSAVKATNDSVFTRMSDLGTSSKAPATVLFALGAAAWMSERATSTSVRRRDIILPLARPAADERDATDGASERP